MIKDSRHFQIGNGKISLYVFIFKQDTVIKIFNNRTPVNSNNNYVDIFEKLGKRTNSANNQENSPSGSNGEIIPYNHLEDFLNNKVLSDSFAKCFNKEEDDNVFQHCLKENDSTPHKNGSDNDEGPLIINNFINANGQSMDLHQHAIYKAIDPIKERWILQDSPVVGLDMNICKMYKSIIESKICVFDMTHYEDPVNAYMFFLLGFAHAKEKSAIPVINRKKNMSMHFDVGGLWQVYYDKNDELRDGLSETIKNIDSEIEKYKEIDKKERPYRLIWNDLLKEKNLHVFTCARPGTPGERKTRTNIDKWDYMTVNELTYFVAQKYETSEVIAEEPMNKLEVTELNDIGKKDIAEKIEKEIQKAKNEAIKKKKLGIGYVIVGSPDVSDYSEIVLAKIHDIDSYCRNIEEDDMPFLFFKKTEKQGVNKHHPRTLSSFYRDPCEKHRNKDGVYFNGEFTALEERDVPNTNGGETTIIGETCIIITIAKNPYPSPNEEFYDVMVLSGFTGVGTYGAIKLFTEPAKKFDHKEDAKSKEDSEKAKNYIEELKKYLQGIDKIKNNENIVGWNTLLMVTYTSDKNKPGDPRELTSIKYIGTKEIPKKL